MKFGIIGFGRMGKVYSQVFSSMNIDLDFVCDKKEVNVEKNVKVFRDYKVALESSNVDGIIIATHGPTHFEIMKKAIEKEINYIVCEKPFTTSLKHADEIIDKLKTSKSRLVINYSRRYSQTYAKLKNDLYQKNIIGKPRSVIITCGAGGLSAVGTHFFDLCSFLLQSKVKSVSAFPVDKNLPNPRGKEFKDPGGYVLLNFEDGARAFLDLGDDLGIKPVIEIIGEFGRIVVDEQNKTLVVSGRSTEDRKKPMNLYVLPNPIIKNDPFVLESLDEMITTMLHNLISDSEVTVQVELAREKVEIYSAIRKSFETGFPVTLPLKNEFYEKEFMVT